MAKRRYFYTKVSARVIGGMQTFTSYPAHQAFQRIVKEEGQVDDSWIESIYSKVFRFGDCLLVQSKTMRSKNCNDTRVMMFQCQDEESAKLEFEVIKEMLWNYRSLVNLPRTQKIRMAEVVESILTTHGCVHIKGQFPEHVSKWYDRLEFLYYT